MKKFPALLLLTAACAFSQVETLNLGSHGQLTLYLLGDWKVNSTNIADQFSIMIEPAKESANCSCKIEITFPQSDLYSTKAKLKLRAEADCKQFEEESVEGKAYARELSLNVPGGYGFVCNFTDSSLRGKPSQPGNFKVVTAGKIRLAPDVLVDVFIGADAFKDENYQQLLGAIEGMEFKGGRGR